MVDGAPRPVRPKRYRDCSTSTKDRLVAGGLPDFNTLEDYL